MNQATARAKDAIVVGGGIAGASISRFLAAKGVRVTLVEKSGQLCSGATWHAAGLVTRFAGSPKLKKLHVRSLDHLVALHEAHGIGLHTAGSIRIIERADGPGCAAGANDDADAASIAAHRLAEAHHHVALAKAYDKPGLETTMISTAEVKALHPLVDEERVACGVWTPEDGDVDPTSLTNCVARLARDDGAVMRYNFEVVDISPKSSPQQPGGAEAGFTVTAASGEVLEADIVVNAAGLWSRAVSRMVGLEATHPAFVIEHQYAITESIPEITENHAQSGSNRLPVLRDLRGSSYIRQVNTDFFDRARTAFTDNDVSFNAGPCICISPAATPPRLLASSTLNPAFTSSHPRRTCTLTNRRVTVFWWAPTRPTASSRRGKTDRPRS